MGVFGLQYGLSTAMVLQFTYYGWIIRQTSWTQVMVQAQERLDTEDRVDSKVEDSKDAIEGYIELLACTDMEYSVNRDGPTRENIH